MLDLAPLPPVTFQPAKRHIELEFEHLTLLHSVIYTTLLACCAFPPPTPILPTSPSLHPLHADPRNPPVRPLLPRSILSTTAHRAGPRGLQRRGRRGYPLPELEGSLRVPLAADAAEL